MKFRHDELIINYDDACIYGRDYNLLLDRTAWLSDSLIHFYFRRLASLNAGNESIFLDPSVLSFLMHQCTDDEDLRDFSLGYNQWSDCRRVFCPVNDNMVGGANWTQPGGGTHWSLLVIVISESQTPTYFHFDSLASSSNIAAVKSVAARWQEAFTLTDNGNPGKVRIESVQVPRQTNGYDCGCHVLCMARSINQLEISVSGGTMKDSVANVLSNVNLEDYFRKFRKEIAADIESLSNEDSRE